MKATFRPRVALTRGMVGVIRAYQLVSCLTPRRCRYHPTCSQYALEAISRYGALTGLKLALWRLARCHPWTPGGFDPVPAGPSRRHE